MSDHEIPSDGPYASDPYRTATLPPLDASTVPYAGQARMVLTVIGGLANTRIGVDPQARHLLRIEGGAPRVRVTDEEVRVELPKRGWRRLFGGGEDAPVLLLHPTVAWTIQIRGGLSNLLVELAEGTVAGFELSGGASHVELDLPRPTRAAPIRIRGGANCLRVRRPADVGVSVVVNGGIASLCLDDNHFDAIGGAARLSTGPVGPAPHYQLTVTGGAADLEVHGYRLGTT